MSEYETKYYECFRGILEKSTEANSPYNETLRFLDEQFNKATMSEALKVQVLSNVLPQMAIQFTSIAMNTALELAKTALSFNSSLQNMQIQNEILQQQKRGVQIDNDSKANQAPDKAENLKKQGRLLEAQIAKLNRENELANTQKQAIDEQVKDNRLIKATSILADFIAGNQAGGMIVPTDMTRYFFDLTDNIAKRSQLSTQKPSGFNMTQRKN